MHKNLLKSLLRQSDKVFFWGGGRKYQMMRANILESPVKYVVQDMY